MLGALLALGCGAARTGAVGLDADTGLDADPELERATEALEQLVAVRPHAAHRVLLAIAYERGERLPEARTLAGRLRDEPLPTQAESWLHALAERLEARARGAPRRDDPALRRWVIDAAAHYEAAAQRLRESTLREGE